MGVYDILYSGLSANKQWMEATANNIANMNTTRTADGGPYQRQSVVMQAKGSSFDDFFNRKVGEGVEITQVVQDKTVRIVHDPDHPDADAEGNVRMPAINLAAEMTDIVMAQRAYEANVTTLNAMKEANQKTFEIGKV